MTTHKLLFRTFFLLLSYIGVLMLLLFVFGEDGILVTRSLERRYEELEKIEEEYALRLSSLEKQLSASTAEDAYDDLALSLGYNRSGEKVYYFDEADVVDEGTWIVPTIPPAEVKEGTSAGTLALYALASPILLLVIMLLFDRERDDSIFEMREEKGHEDYSD